jgi:hypothetical protein
VAGGGRRGAAGLAQAARRRRQGHLAQRPGRAAKTLWATAHVVRRHGGKAQEVVVLEIEVPRRWLKRHGGAAKGLWYSTRDVGPQLICGITTLGELSRSPVEEATAAVR